MVRRALSSSSKLRVEADGGGVGNGMKVRSRSSRRADPLKLQDGDDLQKLDKGFTVGMSRKRSNTMTAALYDVGGCEVVWG